MGTRKLMTVPVALFKDRRAGIAILFAFSVVPLIVAASIAYDYSKASWIKNKLNQIADASALYMVSRPALTETEHASEISGREFFEAQAKEILQKHSVKLSELSVKASSSWWSGLRRAEVEYKAVVPVSFAAWIRPTLNVSGASHAVNKLVVNMDFHFLLDTSPSMAIPLSTMDQHSLATRNSENCMFACHSTQDLRGKLADGSEGDLFDVAKSLNLGLPIMYESLAVAELAQFASELEQRSGAHYRMSVSTFDISDNFKTLLETTDSLTSVLYAVDGLEPPLYFKDHCRTETCSSDDPGYNNHATASNDAFKKMDEYIPASGSGTPGHLPQEVMFVITDGMRHEDGEDHNPNFDFDATMCAALKDRGVRLGIVNTGYPHNLCGNGNPRCPPGDAFRRLTLGNALRKCASEGYYVEVEGCFSREFCGQSIQSALKKLFVKAITTAIIKP